MASLGALIFDFDGTIADSERLHLAAFQETLSAELGVGLTAEEYAERYLAFDDRGLFEALLRDRGLKAAPAEFERLLAVKAERYAALAENPVLLPGAAEMIRETARRWPLAIASGALEHEVRPVIERAGLSECFVLIVTAEGVRRGKPDPEIFLAALSGVRRLREVDVAPAECLVLEDSVAGVQAGLAAGMRVLAVTNSYPRARLQAADRVVDSLEEAADADGLGDWFASLPEISS
ncbi:MAG: HAD family phosphatase [bacterium]